MGLKQGRKYVGKKGGKIRKSYFNHCFLLLRPKKGRLLNSSSVPETSDFCQTPGFFTIFVAVVALERHQERASREVAASVGP